MPIVPLYDDMKMHNLGKYILNHELPMFLSDDLVGQTINIIKLVPERCKIGIVDYLDFGKSYLNIYKNLEINQNQQRFERLCVAEYATAEKLNFKIKLKENVDYLINSSRILKILS